MVLTEGTEVTGPNLTNYWLSHPGSRAQLVLDLGCSKMVNGFYLRNVQKEKRGTRDFSIFMSGTSEGSWQKLLSGTLECAEHSETQITFFFPLSTEMTLRYVMFQVDTLYGISGGLHYFSENYADLTGATYSGNQNSFTHLKF